MHRIRILRREFVLGTAAGLGGFWMARRLPAAVAAVPTDNPTARLKEAWTDKLPWQTVVDVTQSPGKDWDARFENAQKMLSSGGGGVVYFPAGTYEFKDSLRLKDGILLRGADPAGATEAHHERYAPPTRFEFPRYVPSFTGDGTPNGTAFKGIYVENPAAGAGCGVVNIDIHRGHVHLRESEDHRCGGGRLVFGCVLRNAAVADPAVPDGQLGQHAWQRFTARHHAAIEVDAAENILVANNRLPKSGDDSFTMNGYRLRQGSKVVEYDGVVFDFDNRPGLYVSHFCIGGSGGSGMDGTPQTHPWGFRKGIVIRDNYIYNTGRMGIGFSGDGTVCANNVIRIEKDVWRPTTTGTSATAGSGTNDNRAIEMRGWRWTVAANDYVVHRNLAADRKYLLNDGEGLMHEDHCNSTIKDSRLVGNRGNTYLSIYKCGEIDGLVVEGNDIRVERGNAIFVVADRNSGPQPCRNVTIAGNVTAGGGIVIAGSPASGNVVKGNRHAGGGGRIDNRAKAVLEANTGYDG
jgi:hypothetical protein